MSRINMPRTVGVLVMEHIAVGSVEGHKVVGPLSIFPEKPQSLDPLQSMAAEGIVDCIRQQVDRVAGGEKISAIGIGFPGIIRGGVVEDSPNFHQAKGFALQGALSAALGAKLAGAQVRVFNDADVMAAGIAATQGKLNKLMRVWTLGNGVGFGRYPSSEGVWEGGHSVITLDAKETFCGCWGRGHRRPRHFELARLGHSLPMARQQGKKNVDLGKSDSGTGIRNHPQRAGGTGR